MEIFRELAQTGDHPDVETVFKGVRERMPTVSLDTVYRTLWWLKELGLIKSTRASTRTDTLRRQSQPTIIISFVPNAG